MSHTKETLLSGSSSAPDPATAAAELCAAIRQDHMALVVFFCSPEYDREEIKAALQAELGDTPLMGCTTAGEISPGGMLSNSISGFSLAAEHFHTTLIGVQNINTDGVAQIQSATQQIEEAILEHGLTPKNTFGFLLVDGLSIREEGLVGSLHSALAQIPLCGGSAGDRLDFESTWVFRDGEWTTDSACVALITTDQPFSVFKSQHYTATDERIVITESDVTHRIVSEVNGGPAAEEYAEAIGLTLDELTPEICGVHPVMLDLGGEQFIRGIKDVNEDGSISFFCAIEKGSVLTIGKGGGLVDALEKSLDDVRDKIGDLQAVISCDCITRRLEIESGNLGDDIAKLCKSNNIVGFSTYGEQYNAMHVNQTFTGVAIGYK